MSSHPRQPLPRLSIPPSLNMQQPLAYDVRQPMYSPALPTSIQQSYHPPFPMNGVALQTPMQPFFAPQIPNAPGRPPYGYHKGHASIAHLSAGMPQSAVPMTPLGQGFPTPMMLGSNMPYGQQFVPRNRRAPSISIGGPPKAPLGGPGRKHSPMPPQLASSSVASTGTKGRKITVNLPQETILGEEGELPSRPAWARDPIPTYTSMEPHAEPLELLTAEAYPSDAWRHTVPGTLDVFLPGKGAWDAIKQRLIEEKLERLGVERGSGSNVMIHAPHARAASISSPADPSLLYFKLNKLQQSQNTSATNSLSTSPGLPLNLSPSPGLQLPPRFQNRHGHSMSLAQPSALQSQFYNPTASFNPFGPNAILGSDQIMNEEGSPEPPSVVDDGIHAPQGRVPLIVSSLAPRSISRTDSRPDFIRGFGLDIPEEDEEELQDNEFVELIRDHDNLVAESEDIAQDEGAVDISQANQDGLSTAAQSRLHSRHVSRLSHTLSLRSVGGIVDGNSSDNVGIVPIRSPVGNPDVDDLDEEAVDEWTGSEDLRMGVEKSEDEESIGEWSNPSDEERARQERVHRRILRHNQHELEIPRRLPNFPRPPGTFVVSLSKDDDVLSNPSEEEHFRSDQHVPYAGPNASDLFVRPSSTSTNGRVPRPLPPLPHSRGTSGHFSVHDPALAHSRSTSEHMRGPPEKSHTAATSSSTGALNPHAKPFVFGTHRVSGSWSTEAIVLPQAPAVGHVRVPSLGKPLNAAAQEFKPGGFNGFTFRPPPGVPQLTFPIPLEQSRPLPVPPVKPSPARAQQGREKRQRRESLTSLDGDDEDGKESMSSFRFPPTNESPRSMRRSAPTTPRKLESHSEDSVEGATQALTFAGFPSAMSMSPREITPFSREQDDGANGIPVHPHSDIYASPVETIPTIMPAKSKRAPIPLDFKRPISSNTVPAGLFKALVGEEKTRRTVRSRLSSREIFEHSHRPSLDDLTVPTISRTISKSRFVTDPVHRRESSQESVDVFTPALKRRSSLPALNSSHDSSLSNVSIPALNLTKRLEVQQYEERLEALLDEKFRILQRELSRHNGVGERPINQSTEAMITEVVTLFRTQLQESAARGLEDSQMDARGELDLELIKDVVQQGHAESRSLLQAELRDIVQRLDSQMRSVNVDPTNMLHAMEQMSTRTLQVLMNNISQLSAKVETNNGRFFSTQYERESLVKEMMSALTPTIAALRPEPVDYDYLTSQLSQAVKPHISQLIDLASDKRETAELIVDSLMPILPRLVPASNLDTNSIVAHITTEVRRVIAPIDAHEIKEQVADLVVERLDSRLAVRDKLFNVDNLSAKVTGTVSGLLEPVKSLNPKLDLLLEAQQALSLDHERLPNIRDDILSLLSDLPTQLTEATRALEDAKAHQSQATSSNSDEKYKEIMEYMQSVAGTFAEGQISANRQNDEVVSLQKSIHKDVVDRLSALPEDLSSAINVLQAAHAEFASSREASKRDLDEIRKMRATNTDLQVLLAKARGAHGQVRVEKDNYSERLRAVEAERDRLRARVEELQDSVKSQSIESSTIESRNRELEDALSQSLARLKASDVAIQGNQERISELENINRESVTEAQSLRTKAELLENHTKLLSNEKNATNEALTTLQKEHERLSSQQSHWDDLHRASEQIQTLTTLIGQADNEELSELRRSRDRSKALEVDHAALQKRFRDQENKATNSERAASAARQSLVQAQQRSSEWERRAKEYEEELETTRSKLDHVEQTHVQLDADFSLAKLQLEDKDAEERLSKDRENKLRDQLAVFESRVAQLQVEVQNINMASAQSQGEHRKPDTTNVQSPPRPDSRASTIFSEGRASTPLGRINGSQFTRSDTPPQSSVWDSMHAPKRYPNLGPVAPRPQSYYRSPLASPTPSTVSITPTQGDDGWWYA